MNRFRISAALLNRTQRLGNSFAISHQTMVTKINRHAPFQVRRVNEPPCESSTASSWQVSSFFVSRVGQCSFSGMNLANDGEKDEDRLHWVARDR